MLMNKVDFCLKVVVLLVRPGTHKVTCYTISNNHRPKNQVSGQNKM